MKKKIEQLRAKEREKEEREARLLKLIGEHVSTTQCQLHTLVFHSSVRTNILL